MYQVYPNWQESKRSETARTPSRPYPKGLTLLDKSVSCRCCGEWRKRHELFTKLCAICYNNMDMYRTAMDCFDHGLAVKYNGGLRDDDTR